MSKFDGIEVGDRVRVVIEGEVLNRFDSIGSIELCNSGTYHDLCDDGASIVSVEKIEPPVEQFQVGDIVRYKLDGESLFALGKSGFVSLTDGHFTTYGQDGFYRKLEDFTSKCFEKVELPA